MINILNLFLVNFVDVESFYRVILTRVINAHRCDCFLSHCCGNEYYVLVGVQCHDAIIMNEINLFGLTRVKDECKKQKKIIEFVIIPS